jgi:hypothetical protein
LYFKEKLKLFGRKLLAKDIKLSDLDADDRAYLVSGIGQLAPQRDRAGRCVFVWIMANGHNNGTDEQIAKSKVSSDCIVVIYKPAVPYICVNQARVAWYLLMAASEDEETQKKGMVRVLTVIGNKHPFNLKAAGKVAAVVNVLPIRWTGIHFCVDNEATANALSLWTILMTPSERVRYRIHVGKFKSGLYLSPRLFCRIILFCSLPTPAGCTVGSHLDVQYNLMTFGIPMAMFPVTSDGKFPLDNHKIWLARRLKLETMKHAIISDDEGERVVVPSTLDILMGRHWEAQCHQGNFRFRNTVAKHGDAYENARKREKKQIAQGVVEELKTSGSRFLRSDGSGYVVVEDAVAREKVSSAFRNRRKALILEEARRTAASVQAESLVLHTSSRETPALVDHHTSKRPRWEL